MSTALSFPTMTITRSPQSYAWGALTIPVVGTKNPVARALLQQGLIDDELVPVIDGAAYRGRIVEDAVGLCVQSSNFYLATCPIILIANTLYTVALDRYQQALREYERVYRIVQATKSGGEPGRISKLVAIAQENAQ